ncbi:MAG: TRAP transporter small permease subunit [Actinomycetota bacterium]
MTRDRPVPFASASGDAGGIPLGKDTPDQPVFDDIDDVEDEVDHLLDHLGPEPRLHDRVDEVADGHGKAPIFEGEGTVEASPGWTYLGVHPLGWVAGGVLIVALICSTVIETDYLIGNFGWGLWLFFVATVLLSIRPIALHGIRLGIEKIATVTKTIAWILAWAVMVFQLFNVVTRYGNDLTERDIYLAEVVSLAAQSFALMFLLGINYGMRDGVNPRIDFWWAKFSDRTKAYLDFTLHALLLLPFTWMAIRILQPYAATSLGRRFNGEWPEGAAVWRTWEQSTDAGALPIGPIKAMILVAFCLLALQTIAELIKTGFVMMGKDEYGEIRTTDAPQRIE